MINPVRLVDELNGMLDYLPPDKFGINDDFWRHPLFRATVETSNNRKYYLESDLTGYPEAMPSLCVLEELRRRDGRKLDVSSAMHCLGCRDGRTYICYLRIWRPDFHLFELFLKGNLWLEAYEAYLQTGNPIDHYLRHQ